jgi:hypothetical protein
MLAHVTPAEMRMLKDKGGAGTINPRTGLPEFFSLKKVFSKIGRAVKKFARSTIGKIVISTALFMIAGPAAIALGMTNPIAIAAVQGFVAGTGSSLAAGGSLKDSLKAGAIGGITAGAVQGVSTALGGPSLPGQDKLTPVSESIAVDTSTLAGAPVELGAPLTAPTGLETSSLTNQLSLDPFAADITGGQVPVSPVVGPQTAVSRIAGDPFAANATGGQLPVQAPVNSGVGSLNTDTSITGITRDSPFVRGQTGAQTAPLTQTGAQSAASTLPTEAPGFFESIKETFTPDRTLAERGTSLKEAFLPGKGPSLKEVMDSNPGMTVETAQALVADSATNLGRQYLPLAAAGMGVAGLAGAFDTPESEMPDGFEGFMNRRGNPERYALNFGGVRPMGSSGYTTYTPPPYVPPTYNAAQGSGPSGVAQEFPRMDGPINGPGTGTSDDVPAMLSDGEFVFTAKAVRNMGQGSRRKGAKKMYALMKKLEGTA